PVRPVRLIVPVGPAGATDITARLVGQWLSERLGQQFIIENRPGAGSNIGTEAVVSAPAGGYMVPIGGPSNAIKPTLTTNSISISSAISHRSHLSSAFPIS